MRADAVFEAALGLALVIGVATAALGASDFPRPVGGGVLLVVGVLLLLLAAFLWRGGVGLRDLAIGNAVTALALVIWRILDTGFSTAGSTLLLVAVAALAALAAAQAVTLKA